MVTRNVADNHNLEHNETAVAKQVLLKDASGNSITSTNPLPVTSVSQISNDLEGLGIITVGTTNVEIAFTGTTESIIITAGNTNTGLIYIGKSNVTSAVANGITFLDIGESVTLDYEDSTNAIFVVSDTASQTVLAGAGL